jgi:hypothetical protein
MFSFLRRRTFYICHVAYHHDRVFSENISEFLEQAGIRSKVVVFKEPGPAPELRECLRGDATGVLGFNSQLDHSWIESTSFPEAAAKAGIPVIQWILDHPSSRLNEYNNSTAENSAFLFSSAAAEGYFNRHGIVGALTASVACVGPSRHSRAPGMTLETFAARPITCLVAMNLRRIGGTLEDAKVRVAALGSPLREVVKQAVERAYLDVVEPLEFHFEEALAAAGLSIPDAMRHACVQMIEEIVQISRRQRIFEVAREFPILIQSDEASRPFQAGATARFEENVDMALTWSRLKDSRSQICVSNMHDMVHDRVLNGLNAGCVNIIEDSIANRRAFEPGRNALFFRYDDDSLRGCLELVCNQAEQAYEIAAAGFAMRDDPPFRFGDFGRITGLARRLAWRLRYQRVRSLPRRVVNWMRRRFR